MRIAVSGTHCSGKTTLIDEFLTAHPEFVHEPEPYTVLVEDYGEEFSDIPGLDDFYRQLEFNVERLNLHSQAEQVIYERCPIDFLAYILALRDLRRDWVSDEVFNAARGLASDGIKMLDLIVFLPLNEADGIEASDEDDLKLRSVVDSRLVDIFSDDHLGIFTSGDTAVVEAMGSTRKRLQTVEDAMGQASQRARSLRTTTIIA
ncbi:MAG TPA: AAA family ATPase [Pyrinomonadaceae bacterium]|nr:AAA family ATPase [Pyrinomonadaceae bacterium]